MASAARRKRLKEAGLCSQCTNPPISGKSRCQKHLDKANELARRRNAERKSFGLCIRCPNKACEGHVLCDTCLNSLRRREIDPTDRREKDKTKQEIRRAAGLCKWCDDPVAPGRTLCAGHLAIEREKVRAYRAERKALGLCWRCDDPVRPGGALCQKHRDQVTAKERAAKGSVARTRPPSSGEEVKKVHPTPIPSKDGPGPSEDGGGQSMVSIQQDWLGVDVPTVTAVVDGDGVEHTSSTKLRVEEPHPTDVPGLVHDPAVVVEVLRHRSVA